MKHKLYCYKHTAKKHGKATKKNFMTIKITHTELYEF